MNAVWQLAHLLADRGKVDELRARADAGDAFAAGRLAPLLADRGEVDELRARANAGDWYAAWELARLLGERGDLDEAAQILRALADADDEGGEDAAEEAARELAGLLGRHGDLDGLQARIEVGDWNAADELAELLTQLGRGEEAERLHRFGLAPDGSIADG